MPAAFGAPSVRYVLAQRALRPTGLAGHEASGGFDGIRVIDATGGSAL